jgi:hypothetical protein
MLLTAFLQNLGSVAGRGGGDSASVPAKGSAKFDGLGRDDGAGAASAVLSKSDRGTMRSAEEEGAKKRRQKLLGLSRWTSLRLRRPWRMRTASPMKNARPEPPPMAMKATSVAETWCSPGCGVIAAGVATAVLADEVMGMVETEVTSNVSGARTDDCGDAKTDNGEGSRGSPSTEVLLASLNTKSVTMTDSIVGDWPGAVESGTTVSVGSIAVKDQAGAGPNIEAEVCRRGGLKGTVEWAAESAVPAAAEVWVVCDVTMVKVSSVGSATSCTATPRSEYVNALPVAFVGGDTLSVGLEVLTEDSARWDFLLDVS